MKQILLLINLLGLSVGLSAQSVISLQTAMPASTVDVVATTQVLLKPGFIATGSKASFRAAIGPADIITPFSVLDGPSGGAGASAPVANGTSRNYIRTRTYLTDDQAVYNEQIAYLDGLGRAEQTVQRGITPTGKDLASIVEYDAFGREFKKWLPTSGSGNTGSYTDPAAFKSDAIGKYSDSRPYAETLYENSPLNRVLGQKGAGAAWASTQVSLNYDANNSSDVAYFIVDANNQLKRVGNYSQGTLFKNKTMDEDGKFVYEYKDILGRVIMKQNDNSVFTYFVYNDLGQLSYVLPPLAADALSSSQVYPDDNDYLKKYGYLYKYDERGNIIEKRLPGSKPIYMVYDKANRLILSQDGNQRAKTPIQWTVSKYDGLGRVLYTGIINREIQPLEKTNINNQVIIETFDGSTGFASTGYTCGSFVGEITPLTVNYYDNYGFLNTSLSAYNTNLEWKTPLDACDEKFNSAKGLLTGTRVYFLDDSEEYLQTALYYNDKGQVVQSRANNNIAGFDYNYNHYNFAGQLLKTYKVHEASLPYLQTATNSDGMTASRYTYKHVTNTEIYNYTYDFGGRLLTTSYKLDDNPAIVLAKNTYDEQGRLVKKQRHNGADTEISEYNIRNQPTKLKSGAFEENLYYINAPGGAPACYNGNISSISSTHNENGGEYRYSYDEFNRLKDAIYIGMREPELGSGYYWESYLYDKHGNISNLGRAINGVDIDALLFGYEGNQMDYCVDYASSTCQYSIKEYHDYNITKNTGKFDFAYDANGNMIKDLDRKIVTIKYNILNLPDLVQFSNGNQIANRYTADGRKLATNFYTMQNSVVAPITVDEGQTLQLNYFSDMADYHGVQYSGNFEYDIDRDIKTPDNVSRIYNPEGYVQDAKFYYYRRDHLGNNREVWCANTNSTVQRTQYYPSGLPIEISTGDNPSTQSRKYNGKEFVEMHGLDEYDSQARWYYPALMCTTTMDPLAEKYYNISPYAWCGNNPVNRIDPDGRADFWLNGKVMGNDGVNDQKIYLIKTTETSFESNTDRVYGAGLSRNDQSATVDFIKANSGNAEAFQNNGIAYTNSIGIESSADNRQAMVNEVSRDNGRGGTIDANNREYGGTIQGGVVKVEAPGAVANPSLQSNASILLTSGVPKFHGHPSGEVVQASTSDNTTGATSSYGGTRTTYSFNQFPSSRDVENAGGNVNYVFGRSDGNVYVYTSSGVQAVIPMNRFVTPKK